MLTDRGKGPSVWKPLYQNSPHLTSPLQYAIPYSGYISPEAIATLTSLESLYLDIQFSPSLSDRASRLLPPEKRLVLPVITYFEFKSVWEYVDDLVACFDAPLLYHLEIGFFKPIP